MVGWLVCRPAGVAAAIRPLPPKHLRGAPPASSPPSATGSRGGVLCSQVAGWGVGKGTNDEEWGKLAVGFKRRGRRSHEVDANPLSRPEIRGLGMGHGASLAAAPDSSLATLGRRQRDTQRASNRRHRPSTRRQRERRRERERERSSDLFAEIPEGVSGMPPASPEGICTAPSLAASAPASSWEIVSINPVIVELAPSPEEALPATSEAPENPDDPKWRRPLDRRAFRRQLARERAAFQEAQKKSQPKKWRRVTR